jgi:glucose-1-phosphate cytidylyltransferase
MKTVILCGGRGTRLGEETAVRPKPMVQVGEKPILWHIMNHYSRYGFSDFTCALGYLGDYIKDYFYRFSPVNNDFKIQLGSGKVEYLSQTPTDWSVTLIDTGADSMTGGRLYRLRDTLKDEGTFLMTYGDGLCDINIKKLLEFHKAHGKLATVTAVRPPARFGEMIFEDDRVVNFSEKPLSSVGWINGGFFVFNSKVIDYIRDETVMLEHEPLEKLAADGQLMAFKHDGFWQCMDTVRDKQYLNSLWESGRAPWVE